jgi:hypothetical protein
MSGFDLTSVGSRIGRYFGLVSALPSAILVVFTFALAASGAWSGRPDWSRTIHALTHIRLGTAGVLSALAILTGLVLHPLQFVLVQMYEGYWGQSDLARRAALWRSMHYWRTTWYRRHLRRHLRSQLDQSRLRDDEAIWHGMELADIERTGKSFPGPPAQFMPTRLGNVLRHYEMSCGAPFGLPAVYVVPQLALVAQEKDLAYLNDQRSALDLAVRLSVTSLMATAMAIAFLWNDGLWLLVALLPYGAAYLLYRGSVVTAHEYGTAMAALIALNRFALYERLGLPRPTDTKQEREANKNLMKLYTFDPELRLDFAAPPTPDSVHPKNETTSSNPQAEPRVRDEPEP